MILSVQFTIIICASFTIIIIIISAAIGDIFRSVNDDDDWYDDDAFSSLLLFFLILPFSFLIRVRVERTSLLLCNQLLENQMLNCEMCCVLELL